MRIKFWRIKGGLTTAACFTAKEGRNRAELRTSARKRLRTTPEPDQPSLSEIRRTPQLALTIALGWRRGIDDLLLLLSDPIERPSLDSQRTAPGQRSTDSQDAGGSI